LFDLVAMDAPVAAAAAAAAAAIVYVLHTCARASRDIT